MRSRGADGVGRFSIDFEPANNDDLVLMHRGLLPRDQVRRQAVRGVVDSGAAKLVLPKTIVEQLGLRLGDKSVRDRGHRLRRSKDSRASRTTRDDRQVGQCANGSTGKTGS